jgi:hypothetical protein
MKKSELTAKQLSWVTCPTCGVPPGKRSELHAGGLRSRPHVARKFAAIEAIESKWV